MSRSLSGGSLFEAGSMRVELNVIELRRVCDQGAIGELTSSGMAGNWSVRASLAAVSPTSLKPSYECEVESSLLRCVIMGC